MTATRSLLALALACGLVPAVPCSSAADAPVPLDYKAYDGWNAIRTPKLSADGTRFAYALTPEDGDPTLVVRDLDGRGERREARGSAPQFAAGSRFVVFTRPAPKADVDAAKKAKKPEAQQPKNGAGIWDLRSAAPAETVENIKTILVAKDGGPTIAYRAEPSPAPSAAASATPAARPSAPPAGEPAPEVAASITPAPGASAAPSPSPSASPALKADKTKETGSLLTIRNLESGTRIAVPNATEAVVSDDDRYIAFATQTKDGKGDGVHVYDTASGTTRDLLAGAGRFRQLAIARDGSSLAFLSDTATYAQDVPHDQLYVAELGSTAGARAVATGSGPLVPSANGALTFSRDGKRVFLGTAAAPTPMPSGTPEPMKVDLWSWRDGTLQSQQKHDADQERKRTYAAVYDLAAERFAQLGSESLREVAHNDNPSIALGSDSRAYEREASWLGERYTDLYAVSLRDGTRRRIARRVPVEKAADALSPGGGYALSWDERSRHWYATDTARGRRVELAPKAGVAFDDEENDHPSPPQPYGAGGWLAGDRGVLLYDRYDVWLADPATGSAIDLTAGAGRRTRTVYSPLQTDPDADAFPAGKPILLSLIGERSFASGFARVAPGGGTPQTLFVKNELVNGTRMVFQAPLHDLGRPPLVAKNADRWLFQRETFRDFRDFWATDSSFAHVEKVTAANPQQAKYRWGSERLISWRGSDGTPLRGVLLVPDGLQPNGSAPMLVYFYERWSSMLHTYYTPAPGTSPNLARYVSNGYVVFLPDVVYRPGHPGRSAENAILPGIEAALRTGYADRARVGIAGHSWAAYQINYLLTRTHRFRAAEAGAAVDNMTSAYGGIRLESGIVREAQYEHTQSRIGAPPWERPDLYLENSGLFHIRSITTPYLTIHNELDGAVPQFQGIEFITAMRRVGKEAYLFSFDGEDHNLKGREQQKYWTVHLDEWFDYWLRGLPRPDWMNGVNYLHRGERNVRPLYGEKD